MYKNLFLNPLIVPNMKISKSFAFNQVKDFVLYPSVKNKFFLEKIPLPNIGDW